MSQNMTLTRPPEHNSRQRISNSAGQMGLAITPQYFPEDQSEMGTTISGSVCIQVDTSTTRVFRLETRSLCDSNRCLSSDMVREDMLCQSPMGPHAQDSLRNQPTTSRCDNSSTCLESSVLVSNTTLPAVQLLTPSSPTTTSTSCPIFSTTSLPTTGSTTSCMAYLRGYCQTKTF